MAVGGCNSFMSRPKKVETIEETLERLKAVHAAYTQQAAQAKGEMDTAIACYTKLSDAVAQTGDAIAALEGAPTLKKMLADALAQKSSIADISESPRTLTPDLGGRSASFQGKELLQTDLPKAEPGFHWAINGLQEWVLLPLNGQMPAPSAAGTEILIPPVAEDEIFEAPELDT